MRETVDTQYREDIVVEEDISPSGISCSFSLIVHNDDINTFDWVIQSLVEVCGCDHIQAEQLSLIVHYKGKASVKHGEFEVLNTMRRGLVERGINATVE